MELLRASFHRIALPLDIHSIVMYPWLATHSNISFAPQCPARFEFAVLCCIACRLVELHGA
eukprot:6039613-Pyramimonas_sp.AAC.1